MVLTLEMLSEKTLAFLSGLPRSLAVQDCRFVHGVPPDSPTSYFHQFQGKSLDALFLKFDEPFCFVGHTHRLDLAVYHGKSAFRPTLGQGPMNLEKQFRYIINVGSVGQPRDGDRRAKYSLWDTEAYRLENHAVDYDVSSVVKKLESRGFPRANALRLL
jgi:diadenosine tetraphosphatase ApaH/serine/threonine PP2A family protein phosphatase